MKQGTIASANTKLYNPLLMGKFIVIPCFLLLVLVTSGCSGRCVTRQSNACTCSNGKPGAQVCQDDGTFSTCACLPSDTSDDMGLSSRKRVFVSSRQYNGDIKLLASAPNGVEGANQLCGTAARAAGFDGTWRAWISDDNSNAIDGLSDVGPWYLVDRITKVFNNKAGLAIQPLAAISMTESGRTLDPTRPEYVWTGTEPGGTKSSFNCANWADSSNVKLGQIGVVSVGMWTKAPGENDCSKAYRLYCFEQ